MRKLVARYLGFYIQDLYKRTKILPTLKYLKKTQSWERKQLEELQFEKLKNLVHYAYSNVPYYQKLFDAIKLKPSDINTLEDIKKIPVLTKSIARKAGKDLHSVNLNPQKLKFGVTGGTTGTPFPYIKDNHTRSYVWGSFYRWHEWMGIEIGDPVLVLWGAPEVIKLKNKSKIKNWFLREFENTYYINSFDLNDQTLSLYIEKIKQFKPKLIRGYLSAILQLANYIDRFQIKGITPRAISTTTETLLPPYRGYLEKIFNAPIYDQYGCGECGSIAFECRAHKGLHINMEHVIIEILDVDNQPVINTEGRIILTDLDNFAMPFIRYENGDIGVNNNDLCQCGVRSPFIQNIRGRIKDTILLKDGKRVHGVFFTDIFNELNIPESLKISRFQVYQKIPGDIEFRIESELELDQNYLKMIHQAIFPFFNNVEIKSFDRLGNDKNGKFRYIISENEFI